MQPADPYILRIGEPTTPFSGARVMSAEFTKPAGILDEAQAVDLYVFLRDQSDRVALDWRDEFTAAFPPD